MVVLVGHLVFVCALAGLNKLGPLELGHPRTRPPNQNQITYSPPHFLHNQSFNMDQKEQNLQMAIADFNLASLNLVEKLRAHTVSHRRLSKID
jgi:hypothetical protein